MASMTSWYTMAGVKGHTGPGFKLPGSLKDLPAELNSPEMGKMVWYKERPRGLKEEGQAR